MVQIVFVSSSEYDPLPLHGLNLIDIAFEDSVEASFIESMH